MHAALAIGSNSGEVTVQSNNGSQGTLSYPVDANHALDGYYAAVHADILARQDPTTGLLPASTAVTVHGDYRHAWVRDNVYSILAVWGLALAYRRYAAANDLRESLELSTVKLMRGLLLAMMKQADRVERFKRTQNPLDALHAKYDTGTGDAVVGDGDWGHLQIDATGLFVLMLAQMTASGLRLIRTPEELAFLQNLVYYLGSAWHTPDYGIWERGHKRNEGVRELNASSLGMAKAALEAMQGFNALGPDAGPEWTIQVPADDVARARIALHSLLPRESASKETDAALLSIIGFPAYAVEDPALVARTRADIVAKLQGNYGCKRFLRDGHQTTVEDHQRMHYAEGELRLFQSIESEWPLFFTYLLLDGGLRGDSAQTSEYRERLERLAVVRDGRPLLPELYYVPSEHVEWEKLKPGSQPREANENLPLVWAQSLYTLGCLVAEGLIEPADLDPLGRRHRIGARPGARIRLALLARDEAAHECLSAAGLPAEGPGNRSGIVLIERETLNRAMSAVGECGALGLSGQSPRPAADLQSVAQVFGSARGERRVVVIDLPGAGDSRLQSDAGVRLAGLRGWFAYLNRHWDQPGEPLVVLRLAANALQGEHGHAFLEGLGILLRDGVAAGAIHCDTLSALLSDLPQVRLVALDAALSNSAQGSTPGGRVGSTSEHLSPSEIADAVSHIVVHRHRLALGRGYDADSVIEAPLTGDEVVALVRRFGDPDPQAQDLALEVVVLLGMMLRADPARFSGVLTLRPWHLLDLMADTMEQHGSDTAAAGIARLAEAGPGELLVRLDQVVRAASDLAPALLHEPLHSTGETLRRVVFRASNDPQPGPSGWLAWRRQKGVVGRLSEELRDHIWGLLKHCNGLLIGGAFENQIRLDSEIVRADMSAADRDFGLRVELLLAGIQAPEYREVCIEVLEALSVIVAANPGLNLAGDLNLDALIEHAVRTYWQSQTGGGPSGEDIGAEAWLAFESSPPHELANALMDTLLELVV
jgi:hypothetical protein